jgi:NitT/TauT family transport system substrate-binding protein
MSCPIRASSRAVLTAGALFVVACSPAAPARESPAAQPAAASQPAAPAPAATAPREMRKVRMAYGFAAPVVLPMFIAHDQGIYTKYGLDVESILMQSSAQIAPAMTAGEIDVALTAGAGVVDITLAGGEQVLIESDHNRLRFYLHTQPDIRRVEDLRDKRVAITRLGSGNHLSAQISLGRAGLTAGRDVQLLQAGAVDALLTALLNGSADGGMLGSAQHFIARQQGYPILVDTGEYQIPYMQTSLAVTRGTLASRNDLVTDFVRAHLEASGIGKRDAALAKRLLRQNLEIEGDEALEFNYRYWLDDLDNPPYPPLAAVQTVLDQRVEEIPAARTANPSDFIDDRILRELEANGFLRQALGPPAAR